MFIDFGSMTDNGITFSPWQWLGEANGEGGRNGRKALPEISVSERMLSFKKKYAIVFKLLLRWK